MCLLYWLYGGQRRRTPSRHRSLQTWWVSHRYLLWLVVLIAFSHKVQKLAGEGTIGSFEILSITSDAKDLDFKFAECIGALNFDLEGRLVKGLTVKGTV